METSTPLVTPMEIDESLPNSDVDTIEKSLTQDDEGAMSVCSSDISGVAIEKRKKKTRLNKFLEPKFPNSLYEKIITSCNNTSSLAVEVLYQYQEDRRTTTYEIIQLIIDVCGYQHVRATEEYDYKTNNIKRLVKLMEVDFSKDGQKFLLMGDRSNRKTAEIFCSFFQDLTTRSAMSDILFDGEFSTRILAFIIAVASSRSVCLRCAGVILCMKILTSCLALMKEMMDEPIEDLEESVVGSTLDSLVGSLYEAYDSNILITDKSCNVIKITGASEIPEWVEKFPEVFLIKRKCVARVRRLLEDPDKRVRLAALETCETLLNARYYDIVRIKLIDLVKVIGGRVRDVDVKVACKAVKVSMVALRRCPAFVTPLHTGDICQSAFRDEKELSEVAAEFVIRWLESIRTTSILVSLAKLSIKEAKANRFSNFVKSCAIHCDDLKNWKEFVEILSSDRYDMEQVRKPLLNIMAISVTLHVGNESELMKVMLSNIRQLMECFQNERLSLVRIFKILATLDFTNVRDDDADTCDELFVFIKDVFKASVDVELLENICLVLRHIKDQNEGLQCEADEIVDHFRETYLESLETELLNSSEELNLKRIKLYSLKLSVLMNHINLHTSFKFKLMMNFLANFELLKSGVHIVTCCKWYLIWALRRYMKCSREDEQTDELLVGRFEDFVIKCLMIMEKFPVNSTISMRTFNNLCDFYRLIEEELRRTRQFERFAVKIKDPHFQNVFMKFVGTNVICNTTLELQSRREYLCNFIYVLYQDAIPCEKFNEIFRYYESYYTEFGTIMESIMSELARFNPTLFLVIMHTLAQCYNELLAEHGRVDIASGTVIPLKKLSEKFAKSPTLKKHINSSPKLMEMSINFAFKDTKNYEFLMFAHVFLVNIPLNTREEIYKTFRQMMPRNARKHNAVLLFAECLKKGRK